ncbi:universal stress protein [Nonomuraea soli]|uniref:Nucleotide-binding universal stress UspA family protein n=1 Tax=Nonomuraea soli TaxID=1032476 RepID=A0A7W0HNX6_9ACTN|nr:universal stress protein [Nonomuraea soli]MBA2890036.1 nucleotide-binding universal stress UspA family protein [Nonomuraea soli]
MDTIVVATDGSASALAAVEWAADDAVRKGLPLHILHVGTDARALAAAEHAARANRLDLAVTTEAIDGAAVAVLRDRARNAAELVLGNRGLGRLASEVLGSVSLGVAAQATGIVVIVRPSPPVAGEVVVGVSETADSDAALAHAFAEAALRGTRLLAVHAWQVPPHVLEFDLDKARRAAYRLAHDRLAPLRRAWPDVPVTGNVACGGPAEVLLTAAKDAALVVLGPGHRGAVARAVLGSVCHGVLRRSTCPVAVVSGLPGEHRLKVEHSRQHLARP